MASNLLKSLSGAALVACAFAMPASAQIATWDPVDEVLGTIGITAKERPHIDYRERAPLVVPKGGNLPPPQDRAAIRGGSWPNDPDVASRRQRAEEARMPSTTDYEGRVIRDSKDRNRYAGVPNAPAGGGDGGYNPARGISQDTVRRLNAEAQTEERLSSTYSTPARKTLTDPPRSYMAAQGGRPVKATVEPMRSGDDLQINLNQPRN